jgi:hypothetical protein
MKGISCILYRCGCEISISNFVCLAAKRFISYCHQSKRSRCFYKASMLYYILQNITITRPPYFKRIVGLYSFRTPNEVALVSLPLHRFAWLQFFYCWLYGMIKHGVGFSLQSMTFIPSFLRTGQQVQKFKVVYMAWWSLIPNFFRKGVRMSP